MIDLLTGHGWHGVTLMILLACSAFFNCSETALFSLTPHQLYTMRQSRHRIPQLVADLMRDSDRLLLTILVGNNAVHILLFANSYVLIRHVARDYGPAAISIGSVLSLLVVLVFAEVIPKVLAAAGPATVAAWVAPGVRACQVLFSPIRAVLQFGFVMPLTRLLGRTGGEPPRVTAEELKILLEMSQHGGAIKPGESTWLQHVVDLAEARVHEVMVPRVDIKAFDIDAPTEDLCDLFREYHLTKIPVYEGDIDRVFGLLYARDVLLNRRRALREMVRPVHFIPEQMRLDQLLAHFRNTGTQLAIVVDEYGGVAGLVTIEDVLEHIVGEIHDRPEPPPRPEVERNEDGSFSVAGRLSIRMLAQVFGPTVLDERVDTMAGLFIARIGRIPSTGDTVRLGNLMMTVESVVGRRIDRVLLRLVDEAGSGGSS